MHLSDHVGEISQKGDFMILLMLLIQMAIHHWSNGRFQISTFYLRTTLRTQSPPRNRFSDVKNGKNQFLVHAADWHNAPRRLPEPGFLVALHRPGSLQNPVCWSFLESIALDWQQTPHCYRTLRMTWPINPLALPCFTTPKHLKQSQIDS